MEIWKFPIRCPRCDKPLTEFSVGTKIIRGGSGNGCVGEVVTTIDCTKCHTSILERREEY